MVDGGHGEFGLHSATYKRFVRKIEETVNARAGWQLHLDASRLTIVHASEGLIALHSKKNNRLVKVDSTDVNSKGWCGCGCRDVDSLPHSWDSERFAAEL